MKFMITLQRIVPVFCCGICDKALKHKYSLERHVSVVHHGYRPFVCECKKNFATVEQYNHHMNAKHSLEKPYTCERGCLKDFASYSARKYHHTMVHDFAKYVCPCGKEYSSKTHLSSHQRCSTDSCKS